jgi:hypothetical protein
MQYEAVLDGGIGAAPSTRGNLARRCARRCIVSLHEPLASIYRDCACRNCFATVIGVAGTLCDDCDGTSTCGGCDNDSDVEVVCKGGAS